jgi:acetyl-CoA carboxylase carboxyltransferase component
LEIHRLFAPSIIIGLARLNGRTVGIVANNPAESNGILSIDTCDKQARFIRWCDAFNIPLIFLVDTPGFLSDINLEQSRDGLIRTAPKPVFAICEATVPMISLHVGKCHGIGRLLMGSLRMGVDVAYAWPTAQVARINPAEAVDIIFAEEIRSSEEPDRVRKDKLNAILEGYMRFPYHASELAMVNDIIDPKDTRPILIGALEGLARKEPLPRPWKKHSLIPQ